MNKLGIIGSGAVGFAVGYTAARLGLVSDIAFADKKEGLAQAQAMDIEDALAYYPHPLRLSARTIPEMADRDILVLATGDLEGVHDRLEEWEKFKDPTAAYVREVVEAGFQGIFIVVSNPCDLMAQLVHEVSGFPKERVIGAGTALDTARLNTTLARIFDTDPKNVKGVVLGEHGESQFVVWSNVRISGIALEEYLQQTGDAFSREEVEQKVRERAWRVIDGKKHTQCGIGSTVCNMIDAIVNDRRESILVATLLEGEYGIRDVFLSTPCVLGRQGIEKVLELALNETEQASLEESARRLQEKFQNR